MANHRSRREEIAKWILSSEIATVIVRQKNRFRFSLTKIIDWWTAAFSIAKTT